MPDSKQGKSAKLGIFAKNAKFREGPSVKLSKNGENAKFWGRPSVKLGKNDKNAKFDGCAKNAYLCTLCTNSWKPSIVPRT